MYAVLVVIIAAAAFEGGVLVAVFVTVTFLSIFAVTPNLFNFIRQVRCFILFSSTAKPPIALMLVPEKHRAIQKLC